MKGFVGGIIVVKEWCVCFVWVRRFDCLFVDVDLLWNVIVLNGDVVAFEDVGVIMIVEMYEYWCGMSMRGNDRGDDLYVLCDVCMKWVGVWWVGVGLVNFGNTCFLNSVF